ncbi:hypothetical protein HHK36_031050 [Tetracentron sinense]|uniref:BSD domain-containing protein n=1 Tax=Tetracentron sinense TaxID=13715 RepID=A0A835D1B1_TETSI|nr:hypothetical protein HHK36_031050 [Tetracentron sinense]
MSWLARSLANSLRFDGDVNGNVNGRNREFPLKEEEEEEEEQQMEIQGRGVKEDLSELTKTLTRQLWGVASFLAPPPPSPSKPSPPSPSISDWNRWQSSDQSVSVSGGFSDQEIFDSAGTVGIRSDFAEIGSKFRTGISNLSNNKAVSEISKIASNFIPFGSEKESVEKYSIGGAVGVTDEVLAFARNIAMHPETWLDFPMADDDDSDDFNISDAQQEHALAVERLTPRLAALRIELCPGHMSEGCFWKIYFVLLHSRLNKHDAELLSTPQIVEARAMMMQDLQNRTKPEPEWSGRSTSHSKEAANSLQEKYLSASSNDHFKTLPLKTLAFGCSTSTVTMDFETDKHPIDSSEMQIIDKCIIDEEPVIQTKIKDLKVLDQKYEDDGDDWLEEHSEIGGYSGTTIPLGNEEDVSFSDLEEEEEEEDGSVLKRSKTITHCSDSSAKESQDWVQLSRSSVDSSKDSHSDSKDSLGSEKWLTVDSTDGH